MKVIKRSGNIVDYAEDKIAKSIRNTATDMEELISDRDAALIASDVTKHMKELRGDDFLTSTYEVRMITAMAMKDFGFGEIAKRYLENGFRNVK